VNFTDLCYGMFSEISIAIFSKLLLKTVVFTNLTVIRIEPQRKQLLCCNVCFGTSKLEEGTDPAPETYSVLNCNTAVSESHVIEKHVTLLNRTPNATIHTAEKIHKVIERRCHAASAEPCNSTVIDRHY
jgi:hypothetical protein